MAKPVGLPSVKLWTQDQAAMAAQIWQEYFVDIYSDDIRCAPYGASNRVFARIAASVGRDYGSVWKRYSDFGQSFGANQERVYGKASAHALTELAARKAAEYRQSPIAALLGEPLPGYSALDKRRAGLVEEPDRAYRNWMPAKPVTLAGEPLRCGASGSNRAGSGGRS